MIALIGIQIIDCLQLHGCTHWWFNCHELNLNRERWLLIQRFNLLTKARQVDGQCHKASQPS